MVKEYSPFTPGVPVPLDLFIGRSEEIRRFLESVRKSQKMNTIERLFITGERGIGKSSICRFALSAAERESDALGLHVLLGGVGSLEEMVRRVFDRLLQCSMEKPWYAKVQNFLGKHIRQIDIFGVAVEFSASDRDLSRAVSDFVPAMRRLLKELSGEKRGLVLVLDDFNGLAVSAQFANWLKSLVDEAAMSSDPFPFTIALVGLPERRRQLIATQPSLDRVFDIVRIQRFDEEETVDFFERVFNRVNVKVEDEAMRWLVRFSGGYPVFMHEIGDAVFRTDSDNRIDLQDALLGTFRAATVIGEKYVEPKVSAAIRSERYQGILKKIAQRPFEHRFTRKQAAEKLTPEETKVFDNFLRRMEDLGAIQKDKDRGAGSYEFTSEIYYLFFHLQASTASRD